MDEWQVALEILAHRPNKVWEYLIIMLFEFYFDTFWCVRTKKYRDERTQNEIAEKYTTFWRCAPSSIVKCQASRVCSGITILYETLEREYDDAYKVPNTAYIWQVVREIENFLGSLVYTRRSMKMECYFVPSKSSCFNSLIDCTLENFFLFFLQRYRIYTRRPRFLVVDLIFSENAYIYYFKQKLKNKFLLNIKVFFLYKI